MVSRLLCGRLEMEILLNLSHIAKKSTIQFPKTFVCANRTGVDARLFWSGNPERLELRLVTKSSA